jgi:hypothetical protein
MQMFNLCYDQGDDIQRSNTMKQNIRYAIALLLLLSIILLARNNTVSASLSTDQNAGSVPNEAQGASEQDSSKPGTVKPPADSIVITQSGTYSIGGFCTITVELTSPDVWAEVRLLRPLPRPLPDGVHAVRQGCLVTYYDSDGRIDELTPGLGNANICFAALPKDQMDIYFHTTYAGVPTWSPLEGTTVEDGMVCGEGNGSGTYVAAFENP